MTKDEIRVIALQRRHQLVTAYNFHCKNTAANCAYTLTQHAIRRGYVQPRDSVRGETLRAWAQDGNAPAWACKAACELALESGYLPQAPEEWACVVWLWLDTRPQSTVEAALACFPPALDPTQLRPYVEAIIGSESNR